MSPENYEKFINEGIFTVRRTNNFWSGTWTNMMIEQILMSSIRLTHELGFTNLSLAKWIV